MKAVMVIIDGMADEKVESLGFKTTYEYAVHHNLDSLAAQSISGYMNTCPAGWLPESMPCILNLLGVPKEIFPKSRASLELLAHGCSLRQDEVVLRCNLAAVDESGRMVSFNGGQLTDREMTEAFRKVEKTDPNIRLLHLSGYRNLIVLKRHHLNHVECRTYPPHEFIGEKMEQLLADLFSSSQVIRKFILQSAEMMKDIGDGRLRYIFYPWGISEKINLPSFKDLYKIRAAAVCGAEIATGIALSLGMFVPDIEGATADIDTNLIRKAQTACDLLDDYDFVLIHINGADEASHRCDYREKIKFIERIDRELIGYLITRLHSDTRIMICSDHATSPVMGKHSGIAVPFIMRGGKVPPLKNNVNDFPNKTGAAKELHAPEVFQYFLAQ
ncbi:MAG: phosphoglycerate mutase [Peptococcaceae bacterium]|nr:phosphoglycerate mutase [Peptococcaceae bacterium]